jgi:glycerate 2-kinase
VTPRDAALEIWRAALAAADVDPLVRSALRRDGDALTCGPVTVDLGEVSRVVVLGCGKAAAAMAAAVEAVLGDRISEGFVVVKDGYVRPTRIVEVAEAGHPVPDARGLAATARILSMAERATAADLVVFVGSGGGSALLPAPAPPVTLEEKRAVTRLLLAAGATIGELNAVRKHLSLLKGGQLARAAAPATVLTLLLSDVIGDPLDVIASGPTAPDPTTFREALDVLARRAVLDRVPSSVRHRLEAGSRGEVTETPKPGDALFTRVTNLVVGNNRIVVDAAAARARALGYAVSLAPAPIQGEARAAAGELVAEGRALPPRACLIAWGETTVTVRGDGRGGRCQELALAAALALRNDDGLVVLAGGTDGTDGPTDAAGGVVDAGSVARGRVAGVDAARALADNDAYTFLGAAGDLLVSGPTNTNLLDLYLVVHAAAAEMGEACP